MNSSKKNEPTATSHPRPVACGGGGTRREFLGGCGAVALGLAAAPAAALRIQPERPQRGFRFVFMPDQHFRAEHGSPEGLARSLESLRPLDPAPEFIVTGGDLIQNCRDLTIDEGERMADRFLSIWHEHTDLPTYHCIGNHDPLGWRNEDVPSDHPLFAFGLYREKFNLPRTFYSFDRNGWHFVVLQNFSLTERGKYISEFTDEQMQWLRRDLAGAGGAGGKPTLIFGHFPPISAIEFVNGRAEVKDGEWVLGADRMSRNPEALIDAIDGGNVRAFFSGHIHRLDRIEVKGLTMICAGSVSGAQWRGPQVDTEEGYGIIDCRPDGSFDYAYHDYGWKAREE